MAESICRATGKAGRATTVDTPPLREGKKVIFRIYDRNAVIVEAFWNSICLEDVTRGGKTDSVLECTVT